MSNPQRGYFVSGPVDFALAGGASLGVFLLCRFGLSGDPAGWLVSGGVLTLLLNWPHFSATSVRLYGSRESLAQYPATALLAPLICAFAVLGSLASPSLIAPLFLKVFLLWSPFHYSGQTIGVTMVYARRAGYPVPRALRLCMIAFVYLSFISQNAASEVAPTGLLYSGVPLPNFGVPAFLPPLLRWGCWGAGALAVALLLLQSMRLRRAPPPLFVLPAVAQYVWFVAGADLFGYRELVPAFHSLQYLLLAWALDLHAAAREGGATGTAFVLGRSARWAATNVAGGLLLFWLLPRAVGFVGDGSALAVGVIVAAVQVHHFFVDGVVWKLKSGAVSSPLLSSVHDFLDAPAAGAGLEVVS